MKLNRDSSTIIAHHIRCLYVCECRAADEITKSIQFTWISNRHVAYSKNIIITKLVDTMDLGMNTLKATARAAHWIRCCWISHTHISMGWWSWDFFSRAQTNQTHYDGTISLPNCFIWNINEHTHVKCTPWHGLWIKYQAQYTGSGVQFMGHSRSGSSGNIPALNSFGI